MPLETIRVAIVEDDDVLREAILYFLRRSDGITTVGGYRTAEDALAKLPGTQPDIVLMDLGLPGMSGIECLGQLRILMPEVHVVVLTVLDDDEKVFKSIMAGAHGYILKKTPHEKLVEAIREVYSGGAPMTPEIARRVLDFFARGGRPLDKSPLSKREREILDYMVEGHTRREISDKLFISASTVKTHVKKIYEKLQVHSKTEAVIKAIEFKR